MSFTAQISANIGKEAIKWYESRPGSVQAAMRRYPPWGKYRISGHEHCHYRLISYDEKLDGNIEATVRKFYDPPFESMPSYDVFGVDLDDLVVTEEQ